MSLIGDRKKIFKTIKRQGWIVEQGRKHFKLTGPDGRSISASTSPSDGNALKQLMRDLRRHGVNI